jgi:hypothetical protein
MKTRELPPASIFTTTSVRGCTSIEHIGCPVPEPKPFDGGLQTSGGSGANTELLWYGENVSGTNRLLPWLQSFREEFPGEASDCARKEDQRDAPMLESRLKSTEEAFDVRTDLFTRERKPSIWTIVLDIRNQPANHSLLGVVVDKVRVEPA